MFAKTLFASGRQLRLRNCKIFYPKSLESNFVGIKKHLPKQVLFLSKTFVFDYLWFAFALAFMFDAGALVAGRFAPAFAALAAVLAAFAIVFAAV